MISVIIPTFNRAALLPAAMESVRAQAPCPLELVVVDDGSTDDTADVVSAWRVVHEHEDIHVVYRRQENGGPGSARNHGMRVATGEALHFLDSDCRLAGGFLESLHARLRDTPSAPFAYGLTRFVDGQGRVSDEIGAPPDADRFVDAVAMNLTCIAPLWRRETVAGIAWDESLSCLEDWAFKAEAVIAHGQGEYVPGAVATALLHDADRVSAHGTPGFLDGQLSAFRRVNALLPDSPVADAARSQVARRILSVYKAYLGCSDWDGARKSLTLSAAVAPPGTPVACVCRLGMTLGPKMTARLARMAGRMNR